MTVKVFTGSGQFTVKDEKPTANRASYIQASGGNETIVSTNDKLSHPYCGTSKCCGMCKSANVTEPEQENIMPAYRVLKGLQEEQMYRELMDRELMDNEFSEHCETFFKGKNKD